MEGCIEKRWRGNRKRGSVVKFREMQSEGEGAEGLGACTNPAGYSVGDLLSPWSYLAGV